MNTFARAVIDAAQSVRGAIAHRNHPVSRAANFELSRYYGSWHVIEAIPLAPERAAFSPVETYAPGSKPGEIAIQYRYRKDGFEGALETKEMSADVVAGTSDAEWGVKVLGLHAQYVVAFVEPDYSAVIVARDARDHVWIMSRVPVLPPGKLGEYREKVVEMGYDATKLFFFPQRFIA